MAGTIHDARELLPQLEVDGPGTQRRLTVFFRIILLIPQFIIVAALSVAAGVVTVIGWFAALVLGRLPGWCARFLAGFLGYQMRVNAYWQLLVDRYPPISLSAPGYPARVEVAPGRLNRLAVLFRIILAIPAAIVATILEYGWQACAFFCWVAVLIIGRTPRPLFGASAAVLRYSTRYQAYLMMLTSSYPKRLFGDERPVAPRDDDTRARTNGTRPLVLSRGALILLIVFIVLGVLAVINNGMNHGFSM